MNRILSLTLVLVLAIVAAAPEALAFPDPLQGAVLASDWECEQACYDDYLQCAYSCPACDQCSCQLAYCRVNCGVPFQGC